ncbi:MAG: sigma 54-interacting transcriptional regulator [Thermoanaerobaculia bacterium]|jgi:DNA-binding NtrC family response regulator/tetratricopeptide (TPR) repeat protein
MAMRKSAGRRGEPVAASSGNFDWPASLVATTRHTAMPWLPCRDDERDEAMPLSSIGRLGERDALSLTGQLAGFLAFARFAGICIASFDPSEWSVVQRRGRDMRLLRVASQALRAADDALPIVMLESIAARLGAPSLDTLGQSWARPEAVYVEIHRRLRSTSAERSWFSRAAWGSVEAPGAAHLDRLASSPAVVVSGEPGAIASLQRYAALRGSAAPRVVTLDGALGSPLQPMSALGGILPARAAHGSESAAAEAALATLRERHTIVAVASWDAFDPASKRVVRLLLDSGEPIAWLIPEALAESAASSLEPLAAAPTASFVVAARTRDFSALADRISRTADGSAAAAIESLVSNDRAYSAFLDDGIVPELSGAPATGRLTEPARSYLAAIALLGSAPPLASVEALLTRVGASLPVESLVRDAVCSIAKGRLLFESEETRRRLVALLPDGSRSSLARIAAEVADTDPLRRATLLIAAGAPEEADLTSIPITGIEAGDVIAALGEFGAESLSRAPGACALLAEALIRCGRYRDARPYAGAAASPDGAIALARIERRLGHYAAAVAHLETIEKPGFDAVLLAGELERLRGRHEHAAAFFSRCDAMASTPRERAMLAYERAIDALDRGTDGADTDAISAEPYLAARLASYVDEGAGRHAEAAEHAREATRAATCVPDRIDAELDLVYALFLSGDWDAARHQAREALLVVEETQGDRAAAGILFTLAFLCADAGQWSQAIQKIERLRRFYLEREDSRRAREIDLLTAQLDLCRLRLESADRHAAPLLQGPVSPEMREAVAVILDEVAWLRGTLASPRSSGESQCVELTDRHLLSVARTSRSNPHGFRRRFIRELALWEIERLRGRALDPPVAESPSDRLMLLRSSLALHERRLGEGLDETIAALSRELEVGEITIAPRSAPPASSKELEILRLAVKAELPFTETALGDVRWRFATRNRLGRWSEVGSEQPPLDADALDAIAARQPDDWIAAGTASILHVEGLSSWSPESQRALALTFRDRHELANLRRLAAAEENAPARPRDSGAGGIVGNSPAIRATLALVGTAASRDVPVCIEGESGTGKELVARAVHDRSSRRNRPFTAVNCAALPENLVESELFGAVRGAFTGADRDREGLIEATAGGTLFLDEIGEMAPPAQAKLLRFLQEGEFRRVGDTATRKADVRVIAATNRRLDEAVDSGTFRDDLYYRIRVIEIPVPPLRERGGDILLLAGHFLERERELHGGGAGRLAEEVEDLLLSHDWPGNVRELQNAIRTAHALAGEAAVVTVDHLPARLRDGAVRRPKRGTFNEELNRFRRELIERTLSDTGGNQSRAAKELGLSRQALAYQIRELGILVKRS